MSISLDPPDAGPTIPGFSPVIYEGDPFIVRCEITGGHPLTNISWICPHDAGLSVTPGGDTNKRWSILSGTADRTLNNKSCTCSADHVAWIPAGARSEILGPISVYCK